MQTESPRRMFESLRGAHRWVAALMLFLGSCKPKPEVTFETLEGNASHGKSLFTQHGCVACHSIPGVRRAIGVAGPDLDSFAARSYVGGVAENTPENVVAWIRNPQSLNSRSGMPNLHVNEEDAKDMEAYLRRLR